MSINEKSLKTMFGLLLFSVCLFGGKAFAEVYDSVVNATNTIQSVAYPSFQDAELKEAYAQDIEGVNESLLVADQETDSVAKNELYQDALDTVNDLIVKTDGCVAGNPDDENWIVNCTDASTVLTSLNQLATDISALIQ